MVADGRPAVEGDLAAARRHTGRAATLRSPSGSRRRSARSGSSRDRCEGRSTRARTRTPARAPGCASRRTGSASRGRRPLRCPPAPRSCRARRATPSGSTIPQAARSKALDEAGIREHEHGDVARGELSELLLRPPRRAVVGEAAVLDGKPDARDRSSSGSRWRRRGSASPNDHHTNRLSSVGWVIGTGGRRRRGGPLGDDAHRAPSPPAASGALVGGRGDAPRCAGVDLEQPVGRRLRAEVALVLAAGSCAEALDEVAVVGQAPEGARPGRPRRRARRGGRSRRRRRSRPGCRAARR